MIRLILIHGVIAGGVVIGVMIAGIALSGGQGVMSSQALGYLTMLVALSAIFFAVKRHRDEALGGVIKLLPALGVGLGVAAVAGVIYVAAWEVYLVATDYAFMGAYVEAQIAALEAKGVSPAELDEAAGRLRELEASYANPFFRIPLTFLEIFPVGVLVALISAALLRNPRFLPRR